MHNFNRVAASNGSSASGFAFFNTLASFLAASLAKINLPFGVSARIGFGQYRGKASIVLISVSPEPEIGADDGVGMRAGEIARGNP